MSNRLLRNCVLLPSCLLWGLQELIALQRARLRRPRRPA